MQKKSKEKDSMTNYFLSINSEMLAVLLLQIELHLLYSRRVWYSEKPQNPMAAYTLQSPPQAQKAPG